MDPVQQSSSLYEAEKIQNQILKETKVLGWYHSHPNITVFPSKIDIKTQHDYQQLSDKYVGLILSTQAGRIHVIAFQSIYKTQFQINEVED